jgi:hypothetical protein
MPDTAHVKPANDWVEHTDTEDCVCCPWVNPVQRDDGSYGWVIVHHSLDAREIQEGTDAAQR